MIDRIQKIREEVERLKEIAEYNISHSKMDRGAWMHQVSVCTNLLSFIDSMQEEPDLNWKDMSLQEKKNLVAKLSEDIRKEEPVSKDLEKAAKYHLYSCILYDDVYVGNPTDEDCIEMFKAGANWQKQQMMTKSIEAVVSQVPCSNEIILYNPSSVDKYYLPQEMNKLGLNKGDKVKLVIIKED